MFKKQKWDINPDYPEMTVRYIGKIETVGAFESGCTRRPVQRIWDNAPNEKNLRRASMQVSNDGIVLKDLEKRNVDVTFDIRSISYCAAEKSPHERIFSWIAKRSATDHLYCYAVLCPSKEKAQNAAIQLSRAFQNAHQQDLNMEKQKSSSCSGSSTGSSSEIP